VPRRLHRYYGAGYLHFITTSCYQRRALLGKKQNRDLFLEVLEQVRRRYRFVVIGYVVMPEHVHLLLGEPERRNPSVVMQALKQGFARRLLQKMRRRDSRQGDLWDAALEEGHIWQRRFVLEPQQWAASSFRHYEYGEHGAVLVNEAQRAELQVRKPALYHQHECPPVEHHDGWGSLR